MSERLKRSDFPIWAVHVSEYYGDEPPKHRITQYSRLFMTSCDAVDELNRIIRNEWTTEVPYRGALRKMADCPGATDGDDICKAMWHYARNKKVAWAFFEDGHGYKGSVTALFPRKGKRK